MIHVVILEADMVAEAKIVNQICWSELMFCQSHMWHSIYTSASRYMTTFLQYCGETMAALRMSTSIVEL